MPNHFPMQRTDDASSASSDDGALRFIDVPLPLARLSRRAVRDLKTYQALIETYQHFVVTLRHYAIELEELRDVAAHCEVARLERRLKQAKLRREIAELEAPSTARAKVAELRQAAEEIDTTLRHSGLAADDPLLVSLRFALIERMMHTLS